MKRICCCCFCGRTNSIANSQTKESVETEKKHCKLFQAEIIDTVRIEGDELIFFLSLYGKLKLYLISECSLFLLGNPSVYTKKKCLYLQFAGFYYPCRFMTDKICYTINDLSINRTKTSQQSLKTNKQDTYVKACVESIKSKPTFDSIQ